jgi:hypothetical protein
MRKVLVRLAIETRVEEIEPAAGAEKQKARAGPVLMIGSCFMTAISLD